MRHRLRRESFLFAVAFGIPFFGILAAELLTSRSPLLLRVRLLTLEDTCAYGACVVVPLLVYGVVRAVIAFRASA